MEDSEFNVSLVVVVSFSIFLVYKCYFWCETSKSLTSERLIAEHATHGETCSRRNSIKTKTCTNLEEEWTIDPMTSSQSDNATQNTSHTCHEGKVHAVSRARYTKNTSSSRQGTLRKKKMIKKNQTMACEQTCEKREKITRQSFIFIPDQPISVFGKGKSKRKIRPTKQTL